MQFLRTFLFTFSIKTFSLFARLAIFSSNKVGVVTLNSFEKCLLIFFVTKFAEYFNQLGFN